MGEIIDEFDYKSKSPTNVGSRAKEVMGVPKNPYSSAKPMNNLGSDINSPVKNVQSFTLNPYN
jgi:ABC-type dipeptide/oligopeptide/nickel transport system ATPase subunit